MSPDALPNSIEKALDWAATLMWRGVHPLIREITTTYQRGVRLTRTAFRPIANRLIRSPTLPKWSLTIQPE
jgi:hypothetical protein